MSKFAKGDQVKQVVPTIAGTVTGYAVDQETGSVLIHVEWVGEDGVPCARFFKEAELEANPAPPGA